MQVAFPSSPPAKSVDDEPLTEISMKLNEDFTKKLGFSEEGDEIKKPERSWSNLEDSVEEEAGDEEDEEEVEEAEEEEEEEEEFSFVCVNAEGSPITAEEAFEDGQIRPVFPLFNRDLLFHQNDAVSSTDDDNDNESVRPRLRKLFVEDHHGDGDGKKKAEEGSLGPYCSWSGGTVAEELPETCRKSNSTGFSKLWRFRDLVLRSNSDGRDAFVFLNSNAVGDKTQSSSSRAAKLTNEEDKEEKKSTKAKKGKEKTTSSEKKKAKSAHERLYMRNRALKEEVKHRSYLPYKQVGFFTNVNGLSRNIHPF